MSTKHWLLGLLVLLQVTCAAPQLARADTQVYVVVYIELAPGSSEASGRKILDQLASLALTAGALRFDVNREVQRSNRYVLIETWDSTTDYSAFLGSATTQALITQLVQLEIAPQDERDGILIQAGKTADAPARPGEIEVVAHIDVSFWRFLVKQSLLSSSSWPTVRAILVSGNSYWSHGTV